MKCQRTIFHARVRLVCILQKARQVTLRGTCALHPMGFVGHVLHRGAFRAQNVDALFFLLRWDRYRLHEMCVGTYYAELMFLHPVGSAGHVLHSGASGVRNIDTLFFLVRWDWCGFHKMRVGTLYVELVFLHPVGYAGHKVRSSASRL
jgi:hypothetical protein